ncbi:hypothetical protein [Streptomyces sp. 6-11-2]|uniref:hypothetical protein n=1 Tax=Streptomyces sp. 6-11-2 TaxID=2585753 RepID=UPI001142EEDC|nr:hypothetical protein [Streptomyces sp. 6-11-2]GED89334.1 hypothetical protein TNCT6_64190 [Streptomyces sp. 6-11-2]
MAREISAQQPNEIASAPATVQACASDRRTPAERAVANGAANNQSAGARMAASDAAAVKTWGR